MTGASLATPARVDVEPVTSIDLVHEPWHWPFAREKSREIAAHFAMLRAARPAMFNGPILLLRAPRLEGQSFSGQVFETNFASFIAWRDWGFPDTGVYNIFGMGALRGSDGTFLLGEMGAHTANAGRIYFPSGTPDPVDLKDGRLDVGGSIIREMDEETGLSPAEFTPAGWHIVRSGQLIGLFLTLHAHDSGAELARRISANFAAQDEPELAAVHVARGVADLGPTVPRFVAAYIEAMTG
jgi:hypothetical protein